MNEVADAVSLMILGGFLLAGFAADVLGRQMHVPRVTLLLLLGFLAGPSGLHVVPDEISQWFLFATLRALSIIGFHLGERFLGKRLRTTGKPVAFISLAEVAGSAAGVFALLWAFGVHSRSRDRQSVGRVPGGQSCGRTGRCEPAHRVLPATASRCGIGFGVDGVGALPRAGRKGAHHDCRNDVRIRVDRASRDALAIDEVGRDNVKWLSPHAQSLCNSGQLTKVKQHKNASA